MKYTIAILLFLIVSISCERKSSDSIRKEFYSSGNLKSLKLDDSLKVYYDTLPKILKELYLKNGDVVKYYKNGNFFLKGKLNNDKQRIGEWEFYTREGSLSEIREYYIIEGKSYVNQNQYIAKDDEYWLTYKNRDFNFYNQEEFLSDTINSDMSRYAEFIARNDTIYLNKPWKAACFYYTPLFRDKNSQAVIILSTDDNIFNEDFSNMNEVKKDTFYSLAKDIENKKWFPEDDPDYTVVFGRWFDTPGEKIIRGYLSEFYTEQKADTTKTKESLIFFEKTIYVKDTIN